MSDEPVDAGETNEGAASSGALSHPPGFEDIEIDILPDGTVRLHAQCKPGQDPAECEERIRFLVEALGIPEEGVVSEVSEPESGE